MRVAPAEGFGFCLQTNVESALSLYRELAAWLFGQRLGVGPRPDPDTLPQDSVTHPGRYEREGLIIDVSAGDDAALRATLEPTDDIAQTEDWPPMVNLPLQPVARDDSFLLKLPIADADLLAVFFKPDQPGAEPSYVHYGGRAHRRVNC